MYWVHSSKICLGLFFFLCWINVLDWHLTYRVIYECKKEKKYMDNNKILKFQIEGLPEDESNFFV